MKGLLTLFLIIPFLSLAANNPDSELEALVAETHAFNIAVNLDIETLNCRSLGDLDCVYGVCTAEGSYQNQSSPARAVFAVNVALIDETCDGSKITLTELASWD